MNAAEVGGEGKGMSSSGRRDRARRLVAAGDQAGSGEQEPKKRGDKEQLLRDPATRWYSQEDAARDESLRQHEVGEEEQHIEHDP